MNSTLELTGRRGRQEVRLLRAYRERGDLAARAQLVENHLPLVRAVASRFAGRGEQFDDLVQVGSIGLIKAVDRFQPDRGVAFAAYAVPTIRGEISHHLRDRTSVVRISSRMRELRTRLNRVSDELSRRLGRQPSLAEVAAAAGVDESRVALAFRPEPSLTDELDEVGAAPADAYEDCDRRTALAEAMRALSETERQVVYRRFFEDSTQAEIARELGLSQMQVSRMVRQAVKKMREVLEDHAYAA
jgi:RNA polymerase sigma-B factor